MSVEEVLERSRRRERAQTLFYRALAAEAELERQEETAERLNELHADEQHHLSRLTARLLELGAMPAGLESVERPDAELKGWERVAGPREAEEVRWYEQALEEDGLDDATRSLLEEILASERHHREELGGKWMSASPGGGQEE